MKISTKGRYALRMMLDLAEHQQDGFVALKDIAVRQNISKKYLEQIVPMVMPKVIIGPMSFTLGAHVAIFLAMFISPKVAAAVCLGTTMGFFVTTPLIIAARAATHIIFALVGALIIKRYPNIMESFVAGIGLNLGLAVLHALGEVLVVAPFFFSGYMFTPEQLSNGFVMSVIVLVGAGTVLHSVMDCSISVLLWKFVRAAVPSIKLIRG